MYASHRPDVERLAVVRLRERLTAFRLVLPRLTPRQREMAAALLYDALEELWTRYRTPLGGREARAWLAASATDDAAPAAAGGVT